MIPSPQIVSTLSKISFQVYPLSSLQSELQPSPLTGKPSSKLLSSSHYSFPRLRLSPQIGLHLVIGDSVQTNPSNSSSQLWSHPSSSLRFPSSHSSSPLIMPSPQVSSKSLTSSQLSSMHLKPDQIVHVSGSQYPQSPQKSESVSS